MQKQVFDIQYGGYMLRKFIMSIQKDGKTYYTQEEMDKKMYDYIRRSGEDLVQKLREDKKEGQSNAYCHV